MREAVIVSAARTAVGKAPRGGLRSVHTADLAAAAINAAIERAPGLDPKEVEDVILGCAMPEAEQGLNMGRVAALRAGLPVEVPGQTVNRFCASGLQTIALAAQQIMSGMADVLVAGGAESMSLVPMSGHHFAPNPAMAEINPEVYLGMGLTAENVAQKYGVSRADQDAFALRSHLRAAAAQDAGKFKDEIVPVEVENVWFEGGQRRRATTVVDADEGPRRDTNAAALAKLRPVFAAKGSVTAGNSSQTSDGAAAVVVMSREKADALGITPLARFVSFAVGGVPPEIMGIGPVAAVPKALKLAGLSLADIDLIELNEAFAAQAIAVIRALEIDEEKVNVNGGAIALGHPLGCSGAKLTVQILHELKRSGGRYGLVTMCVGGGQGAAGVIERLS
ncbi:MAG TPA: acetyl-CoA C-acyltransferase [Kouleothrix sp.]|uniref:thiolase family protein n=1 Tax=Kouleothrix sp. TaxID=2779161 RepID=UPI002BC2EA2C|nr:acetyl-CoA C-acyltransferase [Kouleothrix sp.]